jgi:biopolymer transport protein ExbD
VTVKQDLSVVVGQDTVQRAALGAALDRATQGDRQQRVFLRADRSVHYGELMEVMNLLRAAGYLKIALVGLESGPSAAGDAPVPVAGQAQ